MKRFTTTDAKQIDLVDYLESLGHYPDSRIRRNPEYWYLSPLPGRSENTPSFKVDRRKGLWYDHGIGKGGSIVDLCMLYHSCSIPEALTRLQDFLSFHRNPLQNLSHSGNVPLPDKEKKIQVLSTGPIVSSALIAYLGQRKIPLGIARGYCRKVQYELNNRKYYAIGFANDAGGYELRNTHFKGSAAPKNISFLNNSANEISVFEGFFDFLTYAAIQKTAVNNTNILVLNSLAFLEKSRMLIEQHASVYLYLDRDNAGLKCTAQLVKENSKYKDHSLLYEGYADLNEWLTRQNRSLQKQGQAKNEIDETIHRVQKRSLGLGR
ncbi:toprim domain-containing protein [Niabella sp. CC-SYL272]|uniref:toprim domain-containing protein n=1 Tax=Niabella agricola TaxID=2891571 RepID=UPI001F1BE41A|nr:toprim domain-containing protein [Niabella agricola]MCF3110616.1 toprim domain-containing protein [Niabella agricola]